MTTKVFVVTWKINGFGLIQSFNEKILVKQHFDWYQA